MNINRLIDLNKLKFDKFYNKILQKKLDNSLGIYAEQILECDRVIKDAKVHKDLCMEKLKGAMGNHISARVSDYSLEWGFISYKAQPEKITPAKEARTVRKPNIKIKKT